MASNGKPELSSNVCLINNNSLSTVNNLLRKKWPVNAYSLFDLDNIAKAILFSEDVVTLPDNSINEENVVFTRLHKEGILYSLHSENRELVLLLNTIRAADKGINQMLKKDVDRVVKSIMEVFPVTEEFAKECILNCNEWTNTFWDSPNNVEPWLWRHNEQKDIEYFKKLDLNDIDYTFWCQPAYANPVKRIIIQTYLRTALYLGVASIFKFNYLPDALRIPIVKVMLEITDWKPNNFTFSKIKTEEKKDEKYREKINDFVGSNYIAVEIPSALSLILSQIKTSEELLDKIIELRKSEKVTKFRNWFTSVNDAIVNYDLDGIQRAMEEYDSLDEFRGSKEIWKMFLPIGGEISADIKGDVTFSAPIGAVVEATKKYLRYRKARNLIYLNDYHQTIQQIFDKNDDIKRIFGSSISEYQFQFLNYLRAYQKDYL